MECRFCFSSDINQVVQEFKNKTRHLLVKCLSCKKRYYAPQKFITPETPLVFSKNRQRQLKRICKGCMNDPCKCFLDFRTQQIQEAALKELMKTYDLTPDKYFELGAKWADENPMKESDKKVTNSPPEAF